MRKSMISLIATVIAIFLSGNVFSQNSFSIHAGPSFPRSDFGDEDDGGGAGVGLNLGGKYIYKLNDKGLGLYLGADFNLNGLKSSVKDDIEDAFGDMGADDITYYKYINVPITAGLNYTFKANEQVSLFAEFGLGPDLFKVTNMTMEIDNEEMEFNFDLSAQLAYKLGGGLLIQDKYIMGLHYNGFGKHKVKGEVKYAGYTEDIDDLELKVDLLTLTFGIKF